MSKKASLLAIQAVIKYMKRNIGSYFFGGAIALVIIALSFTAYRVCNVELRDMAIVDKIELACDININENNEIGIYQLTVAGSLGTNSISCEKAPPMVSQSFDIIAGGTITSIENIALLVYINGDLEAVKYDTVYAVLEKMI